MRILQDLGALIWLIGVYVFTTQAAAADTATGEEKKKACIEALNKQLDADGGLNRPSFVPRQVFDLGLGLLIDAVKFLGKKTGFFDKLSALSQPPSPPS